jgi:hypothetical protein
MKGAEFCKIEFSLGARHRVLAVILGYRFVEYFIGVLIGRWTGLVVLFHYQEASVTFGH